MVIPKSMIKCCRLCCRRNIIVLIWVSVVLPFRKCLRLLRLGLYTVSTPRVNNDDAAIIAHVCYISLLRCNYYHEYLACEEEDLWKIHITWRGLRITVWRALSYFVENWSVTAERHLRCEASCEVWVILFPKINRYKSWVKRCLSQASPSILITLMFHVILNFQTTKIILRFNICSDF